MSEKYSLRFEVEQLPKTPNKLLRRHWRTVQQERDRWHMWVGVNVFAEKPEKPLEKALLRLTRHSALAPDPDGLVGSFKYVIDALVRNGILADDSSAHVQLEPHWEKAPARKGRITVEVIEL